MRVGDPRGPGTDLQAGAGMDERVGQHSFDTDSLFVGTVHRTEDVLDRVIGYVVVVA
jgi:hypothetical protein